MQTYRGMRSNLLISEFLSFSCPSFSTTTPKGTRGVIRPGLASTGSSSLASAKGSLRLLAAMF